ncbi:hypothetical protein NSI01_43090 [Pimelobacter simplex]|nr:hypothetical protein NSI01_43090 [Pimelobacter simplex]
MPDRRVDDLALLRVERAPVGRDVAGVEDEQAGGADPLPQRRVERAVALAGEVAGAGAADLAVQPLEPLRAGAPVGVVAEQQQRPPQAAADAPVGEVLREPARRVDRRRDLAVGDLVEREPAEERERRRRPEPPADVVRQRVVGLRRVPGGDGGLGHDRSMNPSVNACVKMLG